MMISARELAAPYTYVMSEDVVAPVTRLLAAAGIHSAYTSIVQCAPLARRRSLMELEGLGREIWAGEDAQHYVNRLRDEWSR
jgi:hypothetical protein